MINTKSFKFPKRLNKIGKTSNNFYIRDCPQNKIFKINPHNFVIAELFQTTDAYYPYVLVYKESVPMMKDGFMTWFFKDLEELKKAKWALIKSFYKPCYF